MSNDKDKASPSVEIAPEDEEKFKKFTKKVVKEILDDLEED